MKIFLYMLIAVCGAGIGVIAYDTKKYWKKNKDMPIAQKAKGMQIRLTMIPVLLVAICMLTILIKNIH